MTITKKYYSIRNGIRDGKMEYETLKEAIIDIYDDFVTKEYFKEFFGFVCTEDGWVPGKIGPNISGYFLRKLKKKDLWPITRANYEFISIEDLFDVTEFLFDHISKPLDEGSYYHSWNSCGWHYQYFDRSEGQLEYIAEINQVLGDFEDGYFMNPDGEILLLGDNGLKVMYDAPIPVIKGKDIHVTINRAISKFRSRYSTIEDRRDAVRLLADCLEDLRDEINNRGVITKKDDADIYNIANNFGIRHKNDKQKNDYDKNIWLSWMFNYYLAILHAVMRFLERSVEG